MQFLGTDRPSGRGPEKSYPECLATTPLGHGASSGSGKKFLLGWNQVGGTKTVVTTVKVTSLIVCTYVPGAGPCPSSCDSFSP